MSPNGAHIFLFCAPAARIIGRRFTRPCVRVVHARVTSRRCLFPLIERAPYDRARWRCRDLLRAELGTTLTRGIEQLQDIVHPGDLEYPQHPRRSTDEDEATIGARHPGVCIDQNMQPRGIKERRGA